MNILVNTVVYQNSGLWESKLDTQGVMNDMPGCFIWQSVHPTSPGDFYSIGKLHRHLSFFNETLVRKMIHRAYADNDYLVVLIWGANIDVVRLRRGTGEIVEHVVEFNDQIAI